MKIAIYISSVKSQKVYQIKQVNYHFKCMPIWIRCPNTCILNYESKKICCKDNITKVYLVKPSTFQLTVYDYVNQSKGPQ